MARKRAKGTCARDRSSQRQTFVANNGSSAHREVVAKGAELSALVLEVINEFAVLAVLACEDLLELEDGGVDRDCAVELKDVGDLAEDGLAEEHVGWVPVFRALSRLQRRA